ncbi:dolichyldiphosphatase 1-like [Saccostrea echinata]|uniref:dolichyldiphosphatase 1-like n=1 Tax=Saccostrea echinata TaxID=191078 RepID=UPI002A82DF5E|nr:dolichyldiphosphatase 1-like [Saccostrea echinata]
MALSLINTVGIVASATITSGAMDDADKMQTTQTDNAFTDVVWKSVSLTHVEYPKGDFVGCILAWCSLLPIFTIVGFITLILFRRDLHTISYFTGLLLNEACNWILKHMIREHRPLRDRAVLFTEYGMPSSHAQFAWFFSTYMVFFLFIRVYRNHSLMDDLWKYLVSIVCFTLSSAVLYSRVYLGYHTFGQVSCGALLGIFLGALWFAVVQLILTPCFPHLASHPVGEFLMLRDSTLIPHVMWFEYTSSRSEARNRQRKVTGRKSQ